MKTLAHVGMGTGTVAPFDQIFGNGKLITKLTDMDTADALVIWGGEDISPTLYNEEPTRNCHAGKTISRRDAIEVAACRHAIGMGIPIIGVCRGAQLLCALAGGKLVQDVDNHHGRHRITTSTGRSIITSSVHHQMMYPFKMNPDEFTMLAWAEEKLSHQYEGVIKAPPVEPEVVFFNRIKGLAIQGHPEFMDPACEFVQYCNNLVEEYLL